MKLSQKLRQIRANERTVKLGYNDLGYNDLGNNDLGYNEIIELTWLVEVIFRVCIPVITNKTRL